MALVRALPLNRVGVFGPVVISHISRASPLPTESGRSNRRPGSVRPIRQASAVFGIENRGGRGSCSEKTSGMRKQIGGEPT